jgi:hypothetical protein
MLTSIAGKSVVVTGASKGIGKGIARVFARNGAKVTIVARHHAESKAAAKELGGDASAAIADVTNLAELEKMAKSAARRNGGIDVLCANAGIFPQARIEDMSPEQWDAVLATNLKGTFLAVKACVPYLKKSAAGRIVITSSITGSDHRLSRLDALRSVEIRPARLSAHRRDRAREIRDHRQRGHARQHHHRGAGVARAGIPQDHGRLDPAQAARHRRGHRLRRAVPRLEGSGLYHWSDDCRGRRADPSGIARSAEGLSPRFPRPESLALTASLPGLIRGVRVFSRALCLRNLGSMKDAACLGQHCSIGTRRSAHGFPGSPGLPNRASEDGTSKVWPRANCAPSSVGLGSSHRLVRGRRVGGPLPVSSPALLLEETD